MTRRNRILRNIGVLVGLALVIGIVATQIVQTTWFRDYVRQRIITATEDATGGKVEAEAFSFDWTHLQAVVTNFVIRGTEPPASAPLVRVPRVQVNLQLFTSFKRIVNVSYLGLERPEVNVMVSADGRTNIPSPRQPTNSTSSPLETVVNLAVGRFESSNGLLHFDSRVQPLNIQANNFTVQLAYSLLKQSYEGDISLEPVYVIAGRSTPAVFSLHLPVTLGRDRISLNNATVTTPQSALAITGSLENLKNPKTSARITGQVSVADLNQLGGLKLAPDAWGPRSSVSIDADAVIANDTIQISKIQVKAGSSVAQASGTLKDPQGRGSMDFTTAVNLPEMMRLVRSVQRLTGTVQMDGNAKLDQQLLQVNRFHLRAFGAELAGDASLEDFKRYEVVGKLIGVNLQATQRMLGMKPLPYDGVLAGQVRAQGSVDGVPSGTANLTITPGRAGIPISGRVNGAYDGAASEIRASNSYVALPHSRLNFNGSIREGIHIDLTSTDLEDVLAAVNNSNPPPARLNGGEAHVTAVVAGTFYDPKISGHLTANRLILEDRQFESLASDFSVSKSQVSVQNASLSRAAMQAMFNGSVGLKNWTPMPSNSVAIAATLRNGDLADMLVLAAQSSAGYSGALTATAKLNGTIGNPTGSIDLEAANGTIANERFDRMQAQVILSSQRITIPTGFITQGDARVDLSAEYQHARDSLTTGTLNARLRSSQVDLSRVRAARSPVQNMAGIIALNASVAGNVAEAPKPENKTTFLLTNLQADLTARGLKLSDEMLGDLTATATTSGQTVNYVVSSDFAGSKIQADGHTQLAADYPTSLDAKIANLPVERVLAALKRMDVPAKGQLSGTAHLTGTMSNPQGNADMNLTNAVLYGEPLDSLRAHVNYLPSSIDVTQFEAMAGPARVALSGRYDHPVSDLRRGDLQFHLENTRIDLARIRNIQKIRPGLRGNVQMSADSRASIQLQGQPNGQRVNLKELTAQLNATGLAAEGRNLGDLNLSANTSAGKVNFKLDSNLAKSSIHGQGAAGLTSDYPLDAQVSFNDLTWANLQPLVSAGPASPVDVATSGQLTVNGPAANLNRLNASLRVTSLQARPAQPFGGTVTSRNAALVLQNQGDIAVSLSNGLVRIESAHLSGPEIDITASGTASTRDQALNLKVNANANLALLKTLNADMFSSGTVAVNASVAGTGNKPQVTGRAELRNASISYADLPAGIENANGVLVFNGNTATIQTLSGESGGGRVTVTGFIARQDNLRFALHANARQVRFRVQQGVSVVATTNLNLSGTSEKSAVTGTVTINRLNYLPQTDIGSILARSAPPVQSPAASSPILDNMALDIAVRTSSATSIQATLAQNLQVVADLRIRGRASQPGITGAINLTQGNLIFFGSTYKISSGTISFYDPNRIEPILDLSLETAAKGVTVVLTVTGPIDNMKLSYTADPPLQFDEIVSLLAAGKTPTSDPTLLANQPAQPPQTFQQQGESAIVGKALADPVSSRLQRVFGVSQLKIDPSFTSGSQLPQAQVTLQQQVATNLVFTYVTVLDDPNTQIVRIEWSINPQWAASANRDENGLFSVNLLYKKQFR